jgi:hypothetical protein
MRIYKLFLSLVAPVVLAACSIHPLPEDFSRSSTFEIVQKIRCEAREAIIAIALTENGKGRIDAFLSDPNAATQDRTARIEKAGDFMLPPLRRVAIGYTFKFSITEGNGGSGEAVFELPFSNGAFSLGLNVGEDKKRKAERSFDIVEGLPKVLADPTLQCEPGAQNWKYPITGEIGLKEIIRTYSNLANLNLFPRNERSSSRDEAGQTGQSQNQRQTSAQSRKIYQFTDELTFTTTYNASAEPSVELKPVARNFRLTRASAVIGGRREDVHSVTVALAPESDREENTAKLISQGPAFRGLAASAPVVLSTDAETNVLSILQGRRNQEVRPVE